MVAQRVFRGHLGRLEYKKLHSIRVILRTALKSTVLDTVSAAMEVLRTAICRYLFRINYVCLEHV